MGLFSRKAKEINVCTPFDGQIIAIESLKDQTFATKVMGDGVAIVPKSETVVSPVNGVISSLLDTKHAYGITSDDGYDILIHIGQDTVEMNGEGFECFVKEGDHVKVGDKLGTFNIDAIKKHGYETATPIILIDGDFHIVNKTSQTEVKAGDILYSVSK